MKFTIPSKELLQALNLAQRAIKPRTTMPVLSCVLLEASGGVLSIVSDSLDQRLEQRLTDASIEQEGAICAPAKQLIASIRGDEAEIISENGRITVISGGRSVLGCLPAAEFPKWGLEQKGHPYAIKDFLRMAKFVQPCVSSDPAAYVLGGVLMDLKEPEAKLVSCDMKSLSSVLVDRPAAPDGVESIIFNTETLRVLYGVERGDEESLLVEGNSLRFDIGNTTVHSKSIEGMYPNWRYVVKQFSPAPVKIRTQDFLHALKDLSFFYETIEKGCKCTIEPGEEKWTIHASNGSHSSSSDVPVSGGFYTKSFHIDPTRLIRILSAWDSEHVLISKDDTPLSFLRLQDENTHLFAMLAAIQVM